MNIKNLASQIVIQLGIIIDKGETIPLETVEKLVIDGKILEHLNNNDFMSSIGDVNLLKGFSVDEMELMSQKIIDRSSLLHPYDSKRKLHINNNGYISLLVVITLMLIDGDI